MVQLRERFILFIVVANVAILDADICKTVEALPKRLKPADDDITIQKYKEHVKEHHNAHNGCAGKGSCDQSMIGTLPTQVPAHRVVDACDSVKVFMILVFDPFLLGLRNLMMHLFVSLVSHAVGMKLCQCLKSSCTTAQCPRAAAAVARFVLYCSWTSL